MFQNALLFSALFFVGCANAPRFAVEAAPEARALTEATGKKWVISTQGRVATDAAEQILREGGNLIDAAIAASFAISVERPQSTGIGGGGFMLYREAKSGKIFAIDFRERAPSGAKEKMYLDSKGEVIPGRSLVGVHAGGVPGLVRGLDEIHRRFGRKSWKDLLVPAIALARDGLVVYPYLANALKDEQGEIRKFSDTRKIFLKPDGRPFVEGEKIYQPELAGSLQLISEKRSDGFYKGKIAQAITRATRGWISEKDLKAYKVRWREPIRTTFRGFEVVSMPPPSSGGTHLIQMLNILEPRAIEKSGFQSADALHWIASAMQRAYLDRARYMGDPDWTSVPVNTLISKPYSDKLRATIDPLRALTSEEIETQQEPIPEHSETTHFSMMDEEGNMIVSTQTINGWFGSKLIPRGTGILLNNEMDDFAAKPGASNLFGAIGSKANSVQPGKTPLSSMSPTLVLEKGKPRLALGAPGGTRIITCVFQTILNTLVFNRSLYDSINAIRIHQQWKPDILNVEQPGLSPGVEAELVRRGWKIEKKTAGCAVMAVERDAGRLRGVSEPRDHGKVRAE